MLTGFNNRSYKYISKNRMRFIFLLIKRFPGGVVGEPGFPTSLISIKIEQFFIHFGSNQIKSNKCRFILDFQLCAKRHFAYLV